MKLGKEFRPSLDSQPNHFENEYNFKIDVLSLFIIFCNRKITFHQTYITYITHLFHYDTHLNLYDTYISYIHMNTYYIKLSGPILDIIVNVCY